MARGRVRTRRSRSPATVGPRASARAGAARDGVAAGLAGPGRGRSGGAVSRPVPPLADRRRANRLSQGHVAEARTTTNGGGGAGAGAARGVPGESSIARVRDLLTDLLAGKHPGHFGVRGHRVHGAALPHPTSRTFRQAPCCANWRREDCRRRDTPKARHLTRAGQGVKPTAKADRSVSRCQDLPGQRRSRAATSRMSMRARPRRTTSWPASRWSTWLTDGLVAPTKSARCAWLKGMLTLPFVAP